MGTHAHEATTEVLARHDAGVDDVLHVALQSPGEVVEHGGSTGEHNVLRFTIQSGCQGDGKVRGKVRTL